MSKENEVLRVNKLVGELHEILNELVEIEQISNQTWREMTETLNVLDHEMEIIPLNGGQLLKVASFRRKLRIERRKYKHEWYSVTAFNNAFQTQRILNSMQNALTNMKRQQRAGENLIEDRGLIASILASKPEPEVEKEIEVLLTPVEEKKPSSYEEEAAVTEHH